LLRGGHYDPFPDKVGLRTPTDFEIYAFVMAYNHCGCNSDSNLTNRGLLFNNTHK